MLRRSVARSRVTPSLCGRRGPKAAVSERGQRAARGAYSTPSMKWLWASLLCGQKAPTLRERIPDGPYASSRIGSPSSRWPRRLRRATSKSPSASRSARLHSCIVAPLASRSSFTCLAVTGFDIASHFPSPNLDQRPAVGCVERKGCAGAAAVGGRVRVSAANATSRLLDATRVLHVDAATFTTELTKA